MCTSTSEKYVLNDLFLSMCDTRLTSTVLLLICVARCSLEEFNVLCYLFFKNPCLSVQFVTDGHSMGRKWLTGCGDLASWFFFMGVSIFITFDGPLSQ